MFRRGDSQLRDVVHNRDMIGLCRRVVMRMQRFLKIGIAVEVCPVQLTIAHDVLLGRPLGIGNGPQRFLVALGNGG